MRGEGGRHPFRRLVLAVLRRVLPRDWAPDIVRDLEVAHGRIRRRRGALAAGAWLAVQALAFPLRFGAAGLRNALGRVAAALGGPRIPAMAQELRHALRAVRRAPVFHGAVILTLALGLGATTAIFSVVRGVLLEPLPHPDAHRLLVLDGYPWTPTEIVTSLPSSGGPFRRVTGFYPRPFLVEGPTGPSELEGAEVTPDFLATLGAQPAVGRLFVAADAASDADPVVVLSWDAWQRHLGGDPEVPGRVLRVDGEPREVVGVTARGFRPHAPRTDVPGIWVPGALDRLGASVLPEGSPSWTIPLARLSPDVTPDAAQAALDAAVQRYREAHPDARGDPRWDLRWTTLPAYLTRDVRSALLVLQGAVGLVLLLTAANVANLLLVRFDGRRGDVAIRAALGASRGRLVGGHLVECLVLAGLGGVLGLGVARGGLEAVLALAPPDLPRLGQVALDTPVVLAALALSLLTGLAAGLLPAATALRVPAGRVLKEAGRTAAGSLRRHRFSQGLAAAEIALTLVLLVGAGLLGRSFVELVGRAPGFRSEGILATPLHVPDHHYGTVPELEAFYGRLVDRLERLPGLVSVVVSNNLPLERGASTRLYVVEGETEPREAQYGVVSPGYFRTLDIPLLRGRAIQDEDVRGAPPVAVVDEVMRRRVWPDTDPLGRRFRFVDQEEWITVVGVSAAVRGNGLAREPGPGFHISYRQRPATSTELNVGRNAVLLLRPVPGREADDGLAADLDEAVAEVDPRQPVPRPVPLDGLVTAELRSPRFRAALLASFALLALVLAVTGVAGVVGHVTAGRRHEFGVRRAMGATDADVLGSVLAWGLRLAAVGVVPGLAAALLLSRVLSDLLVSVGPADPPTLLASVALVLLATVAASLVPAFRAVRVDPTRALTRE